ncbi:MAG: hypothetical protein K0S32_2672 [Bacteroidetes bacterium]|jgi:hypothetical protein|nr:hypothetical protein [Bacteroidota bacterium]
MVKRIGATWRRKLKANGVRLAELKKNLKIS